MADDNRRRTPASSTLHPRRCLCGILENAGRQRRRRGPVDHPLLQRAPPYWAFKDLCCEEAKAIDAEVLRHLRDDEDKAA